jgi:hypothetical protein
MSNARNIADITNGDDAPVYACRAWVNFNGTLDENQLSLTTGENVYIRDAGNVSSVYYNGTGDYTVNFATEMPDENYCVVGGGGGSTGIPIVKVPKNGASFSTTSVQFEMLNGISSSPFDTSYVCISIFR